MKKKLNMVRGWIVERQMRELSNLCFFFVKEAFEQRFEGSEGVSQASL